MANSVLVGIVLNLFMVESESILGNSSRSMAAFVQYSECSAFQAPPVSGGVYTVRTKTGCARICSEDPACVAYSVSGPLCRTHEELFQTGECYSGGWKHYNMRKRCTHVEDNDKDSYRCKCFDGYIGDDCERLMIVNPSLCNIATPPPPLQIRGTCSISYPGSTSSAVTWLAVSAYGQVLNVMVCYNSQIENCSEGFTSGHYDGENGLFLVHPVLSPEPFQVWCRMAYGGNTFIQRHERNSTSFYRTWQDYKDGFGDLRYDFWLGNDKISHIVNGRDHNLLFEYRDVSTDIGRQQAYYKFKLIKDNDYQMTYGWTDGPSDSLYRGGDCLGDLKGQPFSTFDRDNDDSPLNCAQEHKSGFWFKNCTSCNPNGVWSETPDKKRAGLPWEMFWTPSYEDNLIHSCWAFLKAM